jgi:hypothetical protein
MLPEFDVVPDETPSPALNGQAPAKPPQVCRHGSGCTISLIKAEKRWNS